MTAANRATPTPKTAPWLLWAVFAFTLLSGGVSLLLFFRSMDMSVPSSWGTSSGPRDNWIAFTNVLQQTLISPPVICLFGILTLTRQPGQKIGKLLLIMAPVLSLVPLSGELTLAAYFRPDGPLPVSYYFALLSNVVWIAPYAALIWCLSIFPDGHFVSKKWKISIWFAMILFVVPVLFSTLAESPLSSGYQVPNILVPEQSKALQPLIDLGYIISAPFMLISVVLSLFSLFVRYRRSASVIRQQIKWILVGLLVMAITLAIGLAISFGENEVIRPAGQVLVNYSLIFPISGIGIAILRYRLYDIDILIRRSLTYALLTASLAAVYFLGVVVLQAIVGRVSGGQDSALVTVVTTLSIAALFNPFRRRIQDFIDRRFYRAKYDAERTLAEFARAARDEVDLSRLAAALLDVASETMQPDKITLWIQQE